MQVTGLRLFSDNLVWIIRSGGDSACAVVDPSDDDPVLQLLNSEGMRLEWILATHHHSDHVGGAAGLAGAFQGAQVLCSEIEAPRVPCCTRRVADRDVLEVAGFRMEAILVPGHTRGSVAWHFPEQTALFTGDTLFGAGCGRLFEGTADEMYGSLLRLRALPSATRIYCGHDYTVKNLEFALSIGHDDEVERRLEVERKRIDQEGITMPSTLAVERRTNPFLRADDPALMKRLGTSDPLSTFTELRRRRDSF
ncbi:MAG: hydroxyacylglutathione hydrolase [Verrucomicrobiota bacterium]